MQQTDLAAKAQKIIASNIYMVLASSSLEGEPWAVPVFYAFDKHYNLYWYSRKATRHSQLLANNSHAAVTIFNSSPTSGDEGGVYMRGTARELATTELTAAMQLYIQRDQPDDLAKQQAFIGRPEDFLGNSRLRMYRFTPKSIYVSNQSTRWRGKWIDTRSPVVPNLGH